MTSNCTSTAAIQKRYEKCRSPMRWAVLVLGCLMMVGLYYCCDTPAALKAQIDDHMGNPDDYEFKFGLLFTLYAAPNVVLPIFGGFFVDKLGTRWGLLTYACIIAVGQIVFAVGMDMKSWPVVFLGRFLFGIGGECYIVANTALLSDWFKGKELAFAFGVNLAVSKLGSVLNNIVSPVLARQGISLAMWAGSLLCVVDVLFVLSTNYIDYSTELQLNEHTKYSNVADQEDASAKQITNKSIELPSFLSAEAKMESAPEFAAEDSPPAQTMGLMAFPTVFWVLVIACAMVYGCVLPFNNISSTLLLERDYFKPVPSSCRLQDPSSCQSLDNSPVYCPASHWYQLPLPTNATVGGVYYSPLLESDVDCLVSKWQTGCTAAYCSRKTAALFQASYIMSIPYLISAALCPPVGFFVDVFGLRAAISLLSPIVLVVVHSLLGFTSYDPSWLLVGQGLAYTGFAAVLWPSVPLVVGEEVTGVAFGIVTSMQNLAAAIVPLLVAQVYEWGGGQYIPHVEVLFIVLGAVGTVVGLYLNYYDVVHGGNVLNSPCLVDSS